jgi:hypothetical protein
MQIAIISIFKSYPTVGDIALYMAFLPAWNHLYRCEWSFPMSHGLRSIGYTVANCFATEDEHKHFLLDKLRQYLLVSRLSFRTY